MTFFLYLEASEVEEDEEEHELSAQNTLRANGEANRVRTLINIYVLSCHQCHVWITFPGSSGLHGSSDSLACSLFGSSGSNASCLFGYPAPWALLVSSPCISFGRALLVF